MVLHKFDAMSFRDKVLDALNITKQNINLPVETKFCVTTTDAVIGTGTADSPEIPAVVVAGKPYALSKRVLTKEIGNNHQRTLDVLGFQVGEAMHGRTVQVNKADTTTKLCDAIEHPYPLCSTDTNDTGFHALKGMYEPANKKLKSMRKSAIHSTDLEGTYGGSVADHVHTEWPSKLSEQLKLLNEDPYADSLYYHDMKLRFMITGVDNPDTNTLIPKASNHRGLVRMVILRPLSRRARLRHEGATGTPLANYGYMPYWDTDLFYSKKRMLGGAIDELHEEDGALADVVVSYGLPNTTTRKPARRRKDEVLNQNSKDVHFGHVVPYDTMAITHDLSPFAMMTSPINRKDYAVIADKSFHLDVQHHGVGSQRVENVTIPFRMKARFGGRNANGQQPFEPADTTTDPITVETVFADADLLETTLDEPLNMPSKAVIMFMSMDQKLSVEVEGYTSISEC